MSKRNRILGVIISDKNFVFGVVKLFYIDNDKKLYIAKEDGSVITDFVQLAYVKFEKLILIDEKCSKKLGYFRKGSAPYYAYALCDTNDILRIAIAESKSKLALEIIKLLNKCCFDFDVYLKVEDEIYKFFYEAIDTEMLLEFNKDTPEWKDAKAIEYKCMHKYFKKNIVPIYGDKAKFFIFESIGKVHSQFLVSLQENMILAIYYIQIDSDGKIKVFPTKFYNCANKEDKWRSFLHDYYKISDYNY